MFKMYRFKIEQVTILYPIQCNAMVFIVKGKLEVLTYFVVQAKVIDLELVIWLPLLISLFENSTNKETGWDYSKA